MSTLREALEQALASLPVMEHYNGYRVQALPKSDLLALLAAHPVEAGPRPNQLPLRPSESLPRSHGHRGGAVMTGFTVTDEMRWAVAQALADEEGHITPLREAGETRKTRFLIRAGVALEAAARTAQPAPVLDREAVEHLVEGSSLNTRDDEVELTDAILALVPQPTPAIYHAPDCDGSACDGCGYIGADGLWHAGPTPEDDAPHQEARSE